MCGHLTVNGIWEWCLYKYVHDLCRGRQFFELTLETALRCWALIVPDFSSNALAFASSARLLKNSSVRSSIWENGRLVSVSHKQSEQSILTLALQDSVSSAKLPTIDSDAGPTFTLLFIFVLTIYFNLGALFSILANVQPETEVHANKVCLRLPISRFPYFRCNWFFFVAFTLSLVSILPPVVINSYSFVNNLKYCVSKVGRMLI